MNNRVVVTGMGVITPIGNSVPDFWKNLMAGKSGAASITGFDTSNHATHFACEIRDFDIKEYLHPREAKRMDPFCQYAMAAAAQALEQANVNEDSCDKDRVGVIVGSGIGGIHIFAAQCYEVFEHGPRRISPFFIPTMISDIAAGQISMKHQLRGPNYATTSACATGSHAIGAAMRHLQFGDADVMLAGGSEGAITEIGLGGFNAMRALSTRNDEPERASRPFDLDRDGFVMGEGSGMLVLETLEHARNRGAEIICELSGLGISADAHHITAPAPGGEGAVRAMRAALKTAGLNTEDIDYVNAHGTSTPFNDKTETEALKTVFGEHARKLSISSTKSMTGHLLGAAGAAESIVCALAIQNETVPPTINYTTPDPECDLDVTPNEPKSRKIGAALNNAFGFGGHNACLIFTSFDE
ncbi:beta-ketoacyl-[acyl-carrier-protein] synthase II [candidate division LCP-89 bacterium B3_LCP]|uniref:3-oxoacyl-[acyl-carrier-protein] synthase 2 n=1 Tax=candidate division LCP-89 bacterium B3_LCP TaxID=2012998 RepID=A0A532V690_UNCL8|nr:MAG: beta-ketoacyl-[acyl-carrier-protein] synthase II [candidate division LCP-89 bacterium B3_LCP]